MEEEQKRKKKHDSGYEGGDQAGEWMSLLTVIEFQK